MEPGDFVLCVYGATYHYVFRLLAKHDNERFAETVWGKDDKGKTWRLMYFLTEPVEVGRRMSEFGEYLEPHRYWGFTRIEDWRISDIVASYDSVDRFVAEMLGRGSGDLPLQLSVAVGENPKRSSNRLEETPPPPPRASKGKGTRTFKGRKISDPSIAEARNRDLGLRGELLVVEHERVSLTDNGRSDLAKKVRHVSVVEGDGTGYDIESFTPEGATKYIEVKTTRGPIATAFFISANEVEFAQGHPNKFYLYRVYEYEDGTNSGRFYVGAGEVEQMFDLTPTQYRAARSRDDQTNQ